MKHLEEIKKKLDRELEEFAKKPVSMDSINKIHVITDTIKNIDKICMMEEEMGDEGYSEARGGRGRVRSSYGIGMSYDDDMSYARGRGRNAKRDSMGRYARESGYSEDDYSEGYDRGSSYGRGYSRTEAKDHLMNSLGMMMEDADPKEREALKECMIAIERA